MIINDVHASQGIFDPCTLGLVWIASISLYDKQIELLS